MDRIFIDIDGLEREVFPVDYRPGRFRWEREEGWIFFRLRYTGQLTIEGGDYEDFMAVADDCEKSLIRIEREGKSNWQGYFTIIDGEDNVDDCTFTFTPRPDDPYDDFLEQGNEPFNIMELPVITVDLGGEFTDTYGNCRDLKAVIQAMIDQIDSGYTLDSDFLDAVNNPITTHTNRYRFLTIAQNSDIKRPTATEPVRYAYLSFLEVMTILRDMFQLYWSISGSDLVIEHVSHYYSAVDVDLRSDPGDTRMARYRTKRDGMHKFEKFETLNIARQDLSMGFFNATITYSGKCVMEKDNDIVRGVPVATDIESMADTPAEFPDSGFFLFACTGSSTTRGVYRNTVLNNTFSTGMVRANADLALGNLLYFWYWERVLPQGRYLEGLLTFFTVAPNKEQDIEVTLCGDINPYANYQTALGDHLNVNARIITADELTTGGKVRLTLAYGLPGVTPTPPPAPAKIASILHSRFTPEKLVGTFSQVTAGALALTVIWEQWRGGVMIKDNTQTWNVPNGVYNHEFAPDFIAHQTGDCYELTITPSDLSWTIDINQSEELSC